jgi:hypothetical protein
VVGNKEGFEGARVNVRDGVSVNEELGVSPGAALGDKDGDTVLFAFEGWTDGCMLELREKTSSVSTGSSVTVGE